MAVQARIPVRIYFDDEAQNWHFQLMKLIDNWLCIDHVV